MAVAATDITEFHKWPMGDGVWGVRFKYTGPSSYTASGEVLTKTVCKQAMEGISEIYSLMVPRAMPTGGATSVACGYEVLNTSTNTGTFHFYNSVDAHTHDFKIIGGQTAATHVHDLLIKGGQAASTTNDVAYYATDILGKEQATDATIAGSASATKGGVITSSTPTGLLMVGTDTLGKAEATTRTIAGADSATKGGVSSSTADIADSESAAAGNYSTYSAFCFGIGRM